MPAMPSSLTTSMSVLYCTFGSVPPGQPWSCVAPPRGIVFTATIFMIFPLTNDQASITKHQTNPNTEIQMTEGTGAFGHSCIGHWCLLLRQGMYHFNASLT